MMPLPGITGSAAHRSLLAAERLAAEGVQAEVLDFTLLKPFPEEALARSVEKTGRLVTVEDHNRHGGLSSIACTTMLRRGAECSYAAVCIEDVFTESGKGDELRAKYGTDADAVMRAARAVMSKGGNRHG